MRGQIRSMPPFDPYMQMMPGRYDMRMDPYLMQQGGYGAYPGYGGMMPAPNAQMLPRARRYDSRDLDSNIRDEIMSGKNW